MSKGTKRTPTRTQDEWEQLVIKCLSSSDRWEWGCLSEDNVLFQIATLRHTDVPYIVVRSLFDKGLIRLDDNLMSSRFYKYIPPVPKRRRVVFEPSYVTEQDIKEYDDFKPDVPEEKLKEARSMLMQFGGLVEPDHDAVPVLLEEGSYLPKETVEKYGTAFMDAINSGHVSVFNRKRPMPDEPDGKPSRKLKL